MSSSHSYSKSQTSGRNLPANRSAGSRSARGKAASGSGAGNSFRALSSGNTKGKENRTSVSAKSGKKKGHLDTTLVIIIAFLLAFGLIILYSASYYEASMSSSCGYDPAYYFKKQGIWMLAGFAAMIVVSYIPYRIYTKLAIPSFAISLVMVIGCLFFDPVNGARRWIYIGGFSLQPAEVVKITIILVTATFISELGTGIYQTRTAAVILAVPIGAAAMLYLITDNLSSAIIVFAIVAGMFFVARPEYFKFLLAVGVVVGIAAGYVYYVWINIASTESSFRARRIVAWLDPEGNSDSWSFQTMQALYAIGSGGLFGKGLGRSMQKLGYIPEVQNDMIFSVVCEELGIFGAIAIIAMFILLCWRLMYIANDAKDVLGAYLAVGVFCHIAVQAVRNIEDCLHGVFCHIAVQAVLNIAVVTNSIPNTGVSLPFVSYGGSAVLFTLMEMGIVLNVARCSNG